jgi:LysM repeat protein
MSTLSIRIVGLLILTSMLLFPAGALAAPGGTGETVHVVQWGETLSLIASRYGVTVEAIMAANGLEDPNFLYVGQRLIIPVKGTVGDSCSNYYTVQWGDTLSDIAWRYRTTTEALIHANDLYDDSIYEGQRLCVPSSSSMPASRYAYYAVLPGDTLAAIAWHFGVSQAAIMQANNLPNPSVIYVGQQLLIPGVATTVTRASVAEPGMAPAPPYGYSPRAYEQPPTTGMAPAPPPEYYPVYGQPPATGTAPAPPPEYEPPQATPTPESGLPRSDEPVVVRWEPQWTGSQTVHGADPDEITTLVVMTREAEGVDVMIRSSEGFVARAATGVYYEYSWIPTFAFRDIPGGDYEVWVENQPSKVIKAHVDPGHRAWVDLKWQPVSSGLVVSPAGWIGEIVENTSGTEPIGAFSILVVRTGAIGHKIRVTAPGGYEAICVTGTKLEHGRGACDVGGLNAGTYRVILDGADIAVEVYLDGIGTATVEFRPA